MNNTHKFRLTIIFFLLSTISIISIIHLYSLQIRRHLFFTNLGNQQYHVSITAYQPRATIFDRNNKPLALNKDSLSAFMLPKTIKDKQALSLFLKQHFPDALERLIHKGNQHFLYIKRRLKPEELQCIETNKNKDIHLITEPSRFYPIPEAGGIIGITNTDNNGLFGIELICNNQLIGTPSTTILEKDARSGKFYFSKQIQEEGSAGAAEQDVPARQRLWL